MQDALSVGAGPRGGVSEGVRGAAGVSGDVGAVIAVAAALALLTILCACGRDERGEVVPPRDEGAAATPAQEPPSLAAKALLERFECNRCHEGTGLAAAPRDKHCVRCHQDIIYGAYEADPEVLAAWRTNLVSLRAAPSLTSAAVRLRRAWVRAYLLAPHDLRPGLPATMPRLALTAAEAELLAAHLVPGDEEAAPVFAPSEAERGAALYQQLGCAACHALATVAPHRASATYVLSAATPAALGVAASPAAIELAPDLSETRTRLQPARLAAWIADAPAIKPDTLMPDYAIDEAEARALAAYLMTTPLPAPAAVSAPARPPRLTRAIGFDEVAERVLHKVCWHCHAAPDYARGDGGPGMSGGFGYPGKGLDLSSYSGIAAGSFAADGRRHSVFASGPDGTPRLVAHLLARHAEQAGQPVPGILGMPLGLPALPLADIQLIDSWIAQGRPR